MVKLLHSKLDRFAKLKKLMSEPEESSTSGYIYIGHLPTGFEENNLRQFFSQFGKVLRTKLSRSKTTGGSRGFGFIEFEDKEVAKIAAETIHGFLLFGKQVVCEYMDKVHKHTMVPCKKHIVDRYPEFRSRYNSDKTQKELQQRVLKLLESEEALRAKLEASSIKYTFPGYASLL